MNTCQFFTISMNLVFFLQLLIVMFFILFIKLQKSYLLCPQTISPFKADSRMYSANLRLAFLALSLKAS